MSAGNPPQHHSPPECDAYIPAANADGQKKKNAPAPTKTQSAFQGDSNDLNFGIFDRRSKAIATKIAQLALHDQAVHQLVDGGFLVCRYGVISYHAADLEDLQSFARRLGVCK